MADSKRVSGRQGTQVSSGASGRAPAPSGRLPQQPSGRLPQQPQAPTSGRMLQVPGTSGRAPAQPASTSGRQASPSGRMLAQPQPQQNGAVIHPPSQRLAPQQANVGTQRSSQRIAPVSASGRQSARGEASGRSSAKRKAPKLVGPELLIAAGVLGVLGTIAGILYVMKQDEIKKRDDKVKQINETLDSNMQRGKDAFDRAYNAGLLFVLGKDDKADDAKLFGALSGDPNIYNVLLVRQYKDKKSKPQDEHRPMIKDPNRLRFDTIENKTRNFEQIKVNYGFAEGKTVPVVIATRTIPPAEGDAANLGGTITVIVKAENDDAFENAKKPPKAEKAK